jgi:hypothetical protein
LPSLLAGETFVLGQPAVGADDVERMGRGHEHLRQERIGIERDRRAELVEFICGELRRCPW